MKSVEKKFRDLLLRLFDGIVNKEDVQNVIDAQEIQYLLEELGEENLSKLIKKFNTEHSMSKEERDSVLLDVKLSVMEKLTDGEKETLEKLLLENKEYITDKESMMVMESFYDAEISVKYSNGGTCCILIPKNKLQSVSEFITSKFYCCLRSPIKYDDRLYILKNREGLFEKVA